MKILFIGDVVGQPGRRVIKHHLPRLREQHQFQAVIANAENAAGGFGITRSVVNELLGCGVDILSNGNHAWDKREALDFIDDEPRLLRPLNYPEPTPGKGWHIMNTANGVRLGIINLLGTVFMHPVLACPFSAVNEAIEQLAEETDVLVVDMHAEATSEKMAMGWFLDGRVSAVVGTHTHIPTADERILPKGTAYISDIGMTGCYDSVIGMEIEKSLRRFTSKLPERGEIAHGPASLYGVILDIDENTGASRSIERLRIDEQI